MGFVPIPVIIVDNIRQVGDSNVKPSSKTTEWGRGQRELATPWSPVGHSHTCNGGGSSPRGTSSHYGKLG